MREKMRNLAMAVIQFMKSLWSKSDRKPKEDPYVIY